jgi:NADH dehydrogenase/NADH:ubiquinone reductase (non-electrogenic)
LLPGTAVGTLEFRAIQEPVRTIIGLGEYYQAKARSIDTTNKIIHCQDIFKKENMFNIKYDYLMVATGNKTNTFNIPGIDSHEGNSILFLKHLYHARQIRNRILECFERASNINVSVNQDERQRLLSFIVVGGGPTSCEFITELYDFIYDDVSKWYPDLKNEIKLTLVEAGDGLLGSFHQSLSEYYLMKLQKRNVDVRLKTAVTGVYDKQFNDNDNKNDGGRMYTIAKFNDGKLHASGRIRIRIRFIQIRFLIVASYMSMSTHRRLHHLPHHHHPSHTRLFTSHLFPLLCPPYHRLSIFLN